MLGVRQQIFLQKKGRSASAKPFGRLESFPKRQIHSLNSLQGFFFFSCLEQTEEFVQIIATKSSW